MFRTVTQPSSGYLSGRPVTQPDVLICNRTLSAHALNSRWQIGSNEAGIGRASRERGSMAAEKEVFMNYIDESFPAGAKRNRMAVIRRQYSDRIVRLLKTGSFNSEDKNFRHLVKRNRFELLDLPEAGLRDVLVVRIGEAKEVSSSSYFAVVVYVSLALCYKN